MNLTSEQRCELPNIAVTNAVDCFFRIRLIKSKDNSEYLMTSSIARQVLLIIRNQVQLCEMAHKGDYYAEDFCNTIDKLFEESYNEKL